MTSYVNDVIKCILEYKRGESRDSFTHKVSILLGRVACVIQLLKLGNLLFNKRIKIILIWGYQKISVNREFSRVIHLFKTYLQGIKLRIQSSSECFNELQFTAD